MRERLQEFALSLHSEKTRLIGFGRFAAESRKRRGGLRSVNRRPSHLPGLHLYLQQRLVGANLQIKRKSRRDCMRVKLQAIKQELRRERLHQPIPQQGRWLQVPGRHRLLQLPRGADEQFDTDRVPIPRHQSLAAHATAAEPERLDDLGADQAVGRRLAPQTANPSSVARDLLRR